MRHRTSIATAAAVGLLALTACGTSGDDSGKPKDDKPATATPSKTTAPAMSADDLAAKWKPRLDKMPNIPATEACQDPGSASCGELLRQLHVELNKLRTDVDAAGAGTVPKTNKQLGDMEKGYGTYTDEGCEGDPAASVDGSPCYKAALDVTVGVTTLWATMTTDSYS